MTDHHAKFGAYWGRFGVPQALLLAACSCVPRLPPPSTDIDETAFRDASACLASDDFEGRKPGTAGEEKTLAYLVG